MIYAETEIKLKNGVHRRRTQCTPRKCQAND